MKTLKCAKWAGAAWLLLAATVPATAASSAIFLHPDGMGVGTWHALRLKEAGPDGRLAWDRLPEVAVYVGPTNDRVTASSNGGATSHAWGLRADSDSFGMIGGRTPAQAASGAPVPIAIEARRAGRRVALVNSASLTEPGTGAMVASVSNRRDDAGIAAQLLASGVDIMLGGGEGWFLPMGTEGRHGPGLRTDGRNLIAEARAAGYEVVFTADELARARGRGKLLGLFAHGDTYNEGDAAAVRKAGGLLRRGAPDWDVMVRAAIGRLKTSPRGYLLIGNHEATDDFGGDNASGVLEAAAAADRAIAIAAAEAARDPQLTLVVASDSDSGAMVATDAAARAPQVPRDVPRAQLEGDAEGRPFLAAPDKTGRRLPFTIAWGTPGDVAGGLVARGKGPGARILKGTIDSTDIYRALHLGLFGKQPRR